jgi:cytoskeleton protein RodZ
MTDSTHSVTTESEGGEPLHTPTAGQLIRSARQKQGLHLAVLSLHLKVPVRQLEALEADQHDLVKGPVFVRALASSVCRQLRMDPLPVLALLPQAPGQLPVQRHSMTPLESARHPAFDAMSAVRHLPIQTLLIAAVMLALIAALLWMPSPSSWAWFQAAPAAVSPVEELTAPLPEASAASSQEVQMVPAESVPVVQTPAPAVSAPVAPVSVAPASVPASRPLTVASPSLGAVLGFTASQDSWIEIRDSQNQVLWSRLLRTGESTQVQYPLPMRVVIGRAHAVSVTYQGKAFDLAPHTKVAVARFEVKE